MAEDGSGFGAALLEGLTEAAAWRRGEIALEVVTIDPMPADRFRAMRSKAAGSVVDVERRFGIPAATLDAWQQGHSRPDPAARFPLKPIEADPNAVARVAGLAA